MIVNEQVAIDHGLKKDEYEKICELLKIILGMPVNVCKTTLN